MTCRTLISGRRSRGKCSVSPAQVRLESPLPHFERAGMCSAGYGVRSAWSGSKPCRAGSCRRTRQSPGLSGAARHAGGRTAGSGSAQQKTACQEGRRECSRPRPPRNPACPPTRGPGEQWNRKPTYGCDLSPDSSLSNVASPRTSPSRATT